MKAGILAGISAFFFGKYSTTAPMEAIRLLHIRAYRLSILLTSLKTVDKHLQF